EAVLLLGDPDTIAAARRWHECVLKLERLSNGSLNSHAMCDEMWQQTARDRARFYACTPRSLGTGGGDAMPESSWQRKAVGWPPLRERDRAALADEKAEEGEGPAVPEPQSRPSPEPSRPTK